MTFKTVKIAVTTAAIMALTGFGAVANPPVEIPAPEPKLKNFDVTGTTPENCRRIAAEAEAQRASLAKLWLGKELTDWAKPCPLRVTLSATGAGGATTFAFEAGSAAPADVAIMGSLERILGNQLPHEVAHAVLAAHFRQPVPRWADEGVAILSESKGEQKRHDQILLQLLNAGRALRLSHLFELKQYPSDMITLYTQGYSVARFLVERKDRATFLSFVNAGMKDGWDAAATRCYEFDTVSELEKSWIEWFHKAGKK